MNITTGSTVYIVLNNKFMLVESVWSSKELAQSAIHYHARDAKMYHSDYRIIERIINVATRELKK